MISMVTYDYDSEVGQGESKVHNITILKKKRN